MPKGQRELRCPAAAKKGRPYLARGRRAGRPRQRSHTKTDLRAGCLYMVSMGNGFYKIGRTTNLKRRLVALSSANANLDLVGVWAVPDPGTAETVAHEI